MVLVRSGAQTFVPGSKGGRSRANRRPITASVEVDIGPLRLAVDGMRAARSEDTIRKEEGRGAITERKEGINSHHSTVLNRMTCGMTVACDMTIGGGDLRSVQR